MRKNIYFGKNSIAQIPCTNKIDSKRELVLGGFATAYDSLNSKMLTRNFGQYDKTTTGEINGRFLILKKIAERENPSAIPKLNKLQKIAIANNQGKISDSKAFFEIEKISSGTINKNLLNLAKIKIDVADRYSYIGRMISKGGRYR